jgi:hypothetical protein
MEVSYRSMDEIANKAKDSGGSNYVYSREEMLRIKETPLAQQRLECLSTQFNDDKGLFAPDKWFDQTYAHDTHNKTVSRTKKLLNRGEEELGLSPQRRQFAGGCVPGSTHNKSEQGNSKIWRNGKSGNRDDSSKNESQNNRWKHNKDNDKQNRHRSHTSYTEELPEWMESKISVNDVIELKGFDGHNTESSSSKKPRDIPKDIPLTIPKLDEIQLLQEIQRSDSSPSKSESTSGSRFISFFKRNQESQQQPESPLAFNNSENIRKGNDTPKSSNLNDLFGATSQAWPEMPTGGSILASDIEKRMHVINVKDDLPSLLPELVNTIRNPPEVHIKGNNPPFNSSMEQPKWDEDLIASLLPKHDVFIGKEKQERKMSEDLQQRMHHQNERPDMHYQTERPDIHRQNERPDMHYQTERPDIHRQNERPDTHYQNERPDIHRQHERPDMPMNSMWDPKFSSDFLKKIKNDNDDFNEMIHGLTRTPDLSYSSSASFPKNEQERSISPPHQPPPSHMYADHSMPSRSSPAPPPMLPPFGRMQSPYSNMPMSNNGMPPMMRFPFYPFPMMNPPPMGPNGVPLQHPSHPSSGQNTSSNVTHGGNLPTSVLLRMKSQNSSGANSQRSQQSPDVVRRENNLSSPLISDFPQTSSHRENSFNNSDNDSNSNGPSSSNNMYPRNPNNIDPNVFYNMMMAQASMVNFPMPPGMPGMPPFPPNMPPFHGMPPMPPGMHPQFGASGHPQFFPPGMQPPPSSDGQRNSSSPKFEQQPNMIPESILRKLPSSARPLTVADLERNLLSKN